MAQEDQDNVAAVNVETDEEGNKQATATTEGGEVGSGSSTDGLLSDASDAEATKEAVDDAQS